MKHLVIRNIGSLKETDIELKRVNVIISSQSSEKSCVLKTACYCMWVNKRIELPQAADFFAKDGNFLYELERFHKLKGYLGSDTFACCASAFMFYFYDNITLFFVFEWRENRWGYQCIKVIYISTERNLVSTISNWFQVKLAKDINRNFMVDREIARLTTQEDFDILHLSIMFSIICRCLNKCSVRRIS